MSETARVLPPVGSVGSFLLRGMTSLLGMTSAQVRAFSATCGRSLDAFCPSLSLQKRLINLTGVSEERSRVISQRVFFRLWD